MVTIFPAVVSKIGWTSLVARTDLLLWATATPIHTARPSAPAILQTAAVGLQTFVISKTQFLFSNRYRYSTVPELVEIIIVLYLAEASILYIIWKNITI